METVLPEREAHDLPQARRHDALAGVGFQSVVPKVSALKVPPHDLVDIDDPSQLAPDGDEVSNVAIAE